MTTSSEQNRLLHCAFSYLVKTYLYKCKYGNRMNEEIPTIFAAIYLSVLLIYFQIFLSHVEVKLNAVDFVGLPSFIRYYLIHLPTKYLIMS